jgi:hypothetical protein
MDSRKTVHGDLTLDEQVAVLNHAGYAVACNAYRPETVAALNRALRKLGIKTDDDENYCNPLFDETQRRYVEKHSWPEKR